MNIIEKIFSDPDFNRLDNIIRWSGLNTLTKESVSQHSFFVAMLARIVSEEIFDEKDYNLKLTTTTYALFHDFDESFTGDVLHGLKYDSEYGGELRELLDKIILNKVNRKFDKNVKSEKLLLEIIIGEINPFVKKIVKICDWLSMLFYLKRELNLGNNSLYDQQLYCLIKLNSCCEDIMGMNNIQNCNMDIITHILLMCESYSSELTNS